MSTRLKLNQIMAKALDALHNDWAGMPECDDATASMWRSMCSSRRGGDATEQQLFERMERRIASLDSGSLCFMTGPGTSYTPTTCGFSARRLGDALYVTNTGAEARLSAGDVIERVNGYALDVFATRSADNPVGVDSPERQDWQTALNYAMNVTVRRADGTREDLRVRHYPRAAGAPACSLAFAHDGAACILTVGQLDTAEAAELLEANAEAASKARLLVIDVRSCTGGNEAMTYGLLNWMFMKDTNVNRIVEPERVLTLYTAANCDRRAAQIEQLRRLVAADPNEAETLGWLDENLALVRSMRGRGLVEETVEPEDVPVRAAPAGQIVALLTDITTADAAERLALMAKKARRVVQVGRATRGNLDYSNPVAVAFDDRFIFTYPMTKTVAAAEGRGMRGRGVEPDVCIPFTPEECVRDVLMERTFAEAFGL